MTSKLTWADPRQYAAALQKEKNLVLLYSGMAPGKFSILAWGMEEKAETLDELEEKLSTDRAKYENCWFGYLGYGLRTQFEKLKRSADSYVTLPDLMMMKFKNILVFDHENKTVDSRVRPENDVKPVILGQRSEDLAKELKSNMTDKEYLAKVENIIRQINEGEIYQANLTRKFYGEFKKTPDGLALFNALSEISPAPYSAYLKFGDTVIISASPEKFLTVENGVATSTPIKGTLAAESPAALLAMSEKDRAENLMIVDLMRNDLARTCRDVRVEKLFEVTSYAKYHHMSSTISGIPIKPVLDVVKACFPPGSMTGAPKIQAMKLCNDLEKVERGVYSGAIGYFGGDGGCDLSVVIRTLIISGKKFEFQVGGGIVADSTPQKELEEIYVKARGIMEVLGVKQPPKLL